MIKGRLVLEDGSEFEAVSFGAKNPVAGEVVFTTGMVGYPESLTDPSYKGQILVFTYPLIGNYGVPAKDSWESDGIKVSGVIVSSYIDTPSHPSSTMTLGEWLVSENIAGLEIKDTRMITQRLREKGAMLGKIIFEKDIEFYDPNKDNLVDIVSTKEVFEEGTGAKTLILIDCGEKANTRRRLLSRNLKVITVPWNYDLLSNNFKFDGVVISNGPGDPKMVGDTVKIVKKLLNRKVPILGICLGNQILALAAGGDTRKMKFGHRGQNQPVIQVGTEKCYLTTQNHGFEINKRPNGFIEWFRNANDGTNEGIIHEKLPFMSVQFHPEVNPGPMDTDWVFDEFIRKLNIKK